MAKNAIELAKAFGYLTIREVEAIKKTAASLTWYEPVIVNVGAGSGTSSLAIVEERPDARVFTVDISAGGPLGGLENECNAFRNAGISYLCPIQINKASHIAAKEWKHGPIHMVFIDADHVNPAVERDIREWKKWVARDGVVAFHDYGSPKWPDVKETVDRMMKKNEILLHVDTYIAFVV